MTEQQFLIENHIRYQKNDSLSSKSTLKIGGIAEFSVFPKNEKELISIVLFANDNKIEYRVVGGLSNTLVKDGMHRGFTVFTTDIDEVTENEDTVTLSCGVRHAKITHKFAKRGIGVLYQLSGIPGTVGGGIFGNAGAFGSSFSDECISVSVFDIERREIVNISAEKMKFDYRHSSAQNHQWLILDATVKKHPIDKETLHKEIELIRVRRITSQPTSSFSLGSTFKRGNFPAAPAFYIDSLGLRGFSVGDAAVSEKHAGFIVNRGKATADDYLKLIETIKNRVYDAYGVRLTPEIQIY